MFTVDQFCIRSPNNQFRIHFVHFGTNILSLPPLLDCPQPEEGHWHFETCLIEGTRCATTTRSKRVVAERNSETRLSNGSPLCVAFPNLSQMKPQDVRQRRLLPREILHKQQACLIDSHCASISMNYPHKEPCPKIQGEKIKEE